MLGAVVALPLVLLFRIAPPRGRRRIGLVAVSGLCGFIIFPVVFGIGQSLTSTAHAGLIFAAVPVLVVHAGLRRHVVEVVRVGRAWDRRIMRRALREFAPHVHVDAGLPGNLLRLAAALLVRPLTLVELAGYGLYRAWTERATLASILRAAGTAQRLRPQLLVVYRFMSAAEIDTDIGRERLEACVFRVPVDGEMVSMCSVNAGDIRRRLNERLRRPSRRQETAPV